MNRGRLFLFARRLSSLVLTGAVVFVLASASGRVAAQKNVGAQESSHPKAATSAATNGTNETKIDTAADADNDYSKKIKEYTTEPYFLTELVDHLPASDKVPSPDKILGYSIGTPNKLTYTKDLYRYYRELERSDAACARLSGAREI